MQTMMNTTRFKGEGMKKFSFVVLVVAILVLGLASMAYADVRSTYAQWTSGLFNTGSLSTPHRDFRLTTVKCAVCHAVHKADIAGELLLKDTVSNACSYCHIQTSTGGIVLYGGVSANYGTQSQYAHNQAAPSTCNDCHSVHGANTVTNTANPALSGKILRNEYNEPSYRAYQINYEASFDVTTSAGRYDATSVWCTKCHKYYTGTYDSTVTWNPNFDAATAQVKSHIMTSALTTYSSPHRGAAAPTQVAYRSSQNCRLCHDAGNVDEAAGVTLNSFPHYTVNAASFLTAATNSVSATVPAGAGYTSAGGGNVGPADGVCLKCHASGTAGVGMNF